MQKESLEFEYISTEMDLYKEIKGKFNKIGKKIYLVVDEVQEIAKWEKGIVSLFTENMADIYISGSNARLLSSELATLITGRYLEFHIYGLSFSEFLLFKNKTEPKEAEFFEYIRYGGFPGIHHSILDDEVVYQYISSLFDSIILKDVVRRYNIRNIALLEKIINFIFDNIGNVFSGKRVADFLKKERRSISVETIYNYIKYLESPYAIHRVPRFDLKGKRYLEAQEKYYLGDIGLRHALLGFREGDISAILENIVYLELKRRGFNIFIGKYDNKEIDFVAEKDNYRCYIQVCYLLESERTIEREFSILKKIKDNYPKYVLSMDRFWGNDVDGIDRIRIIDFLINPQNKSQKKNILAF